MLTQPNSSQKVAIEQQPGPEQVEVTPEEQTGMVAAENFDEAAALALVQQWQQTKTTVYADPAAPDAENQLREVLGGIMLEGSDGSGGRLRTVRYLVQNDSKWLYRPKGIRLVPGTFSSTDKFAGITAEIDEEGKLIERDGKISDRYDKKLTIQYYFEKLDSAAGSRWAMVHCSGVKSCSLDAQAESEL